jgi:hypothetical protein
VKRAESDVSVISIIPVVASKVALFCAPISFFFPTVEAKSAPAVPCSYSSASPPSSPPSPPEVAFLVRVAFVKVIVIGPGAVGGAASVPPLFFGVN